MATITMPITMVDEEGLETTVALPASWVICGTCQGCGCSSAHLGAFTSDEMDEQGYDFLDDYLSGVYDRPCDRCGGSGKYLVIDEARCSGPEHQRALVWVRDQQIAMAEERAIVAMETRGFA